jgi:hypothetical protein
MCSYFVWADVIHLSWTKNGKLVKDHKGETDTKQAACSFLREEADAVAPAIREMKPERSCHVR